MQEQKAHGAISPTAKLVSLALAGSNLPYVKQFCELANCEATVRDTFPQLLAPESMARSGVGLELRSKSLTKAVELYGTKVVVECGSGISPLGLIISERPDIIDYYETDLPDILKEKQELVLKILKGSVRSNLHYYPMNALIDSDVKVMSTLIGNDQQLTIIHEGMMVYFTHEEKSQFAKLLRSTFLKNGGIWITPDILLKEVFEGNASQKRVKAVTKTTGSDLYSCAFDNYDQAEKFFNDHGFSVERHTQLDFVQLSELSLTCAESDMPKAELSPLWIMRPI